MHVPPNLHVDMTLVAPTPLPCPPPPPSPVLQRKSLEAYNRMFGNSTHRYDTVARNVLEVLERRLTHHRK